MAESARLQRLSRELFVAAAATDGEVVDEWSIDRIAAQLDEEQLTAGQVLHARGDPVDFIYLMRDGVVRMTRPDAPAWRFEGRWALGPFAALLNRPHSRTATALTGFRILKIRSEAWIELLEESFMFAQASLARSARVVADLEYRTGTTPPADLTPAPEPLTLIDRLALLTQVPFLRGAGVQALADLAGVTEEVAFEAGHPVVLPAGRVVMVVAGEIEGQSPTAQARFGPGKLVGGSGVLAAAPAPWQLQARVKTRALTLRLEDWVDQMEEHFDLVRATLAALALDREVLLDRLSVAGAEVVLQ